MDKAELLDYFRSLAEAQVKMAEEDIEERNKAIETLREIRSREKKHSKVIRTLEHEQKHKITKAKCYIDKCETYTVQLTGILDIDPETEADYIG